ARDQLADAYLSNGAAAEARVVAENLLARRPGEVRHRERLRKALALLGEVDSELTFDENVGTLPEEGDLAPECSTEGPLVEQTERVDVVDQVNVADAANTRDDSRAESAGGEYDLTDAVGTFEIDLSTMLDEFRTEPA